LLRLADLSLNEITGFIPSSLNNLTGLVYLFLSSNDYTPATMPNITGLTHLEELSMKSCQLNGSIPSWVGQRLPNLLLLDLEDNSLTGEIPSSLGDIPNLSFILLNKNNLTGRLHHSLGQLESLSE
jgi:Leucine-rich repeat (LRR) protein